MRPTSDKSSVPFTTNVAQGQEEVNGVDNAKLTPDIDAIDHNMPQVIQNKLSLFSVENAFMDILGRKQSLSIVNQGAPVVNKNGIVLNGNGRTMALQLAYNQGNEGAKAYKDYLTKNAAKFGLTPEQIGKIPNPVLVRQVGDDADVNAIINSTEGGARFGSSEQAKVDADELKQSTLEKFVDNGKGEILNPGNRSFLRAAVQDIKTDTDANTFFTDNGQITQQGAERVRNALFAKAYNDSYILARMSEATDGNSKNVLKAMIAAAPKVAKANDGIKNGEIYPEYDVSKVITDSVKTLMSLRDANKPLDFYLKENSLFDEENTDENKLMLRFMNDNKFKVREMAELFNGLTDRAFAMGNPAQGNMFGDMERPTMVELIKNPNAKILTVNGNEKVKTHRSKRPIEVGAGVYAAIKFLGKDEVERLMRLPKNTLEQQLSTSYPDVEWGKYFDQQEMIEGVGGIEARKHGYDVIYAEDKISPEFTEYVALTNDSLIPTKPFDELMAEQKGESHESTQTSESGETQQHNDENAESQQTQAAEGTEASESKPDTDKVAETKKAADSGGMVVVTGDEFGEYKDLKELRQKAKSYYKQKLQGTSVQCAVLGEIKLGKNDVDFTRAGLGKMTATSAKEHKLLLVAHLPELIKNAYEVQQKDNVKNKHNASSFSYLYSKAMVDGKAQRVTITIFTDVNGNKYYNHILEAEERGTKNKDLSVPPARITKTSNSIPAIDKPSTSSVEQGQEEVNGVDNEKIAPYRGAVAQTMSQAGRVLLIRSGKRFSEYY